MKLFDIFPYTRPPKPRTGKYSIKPQNHGRHRLKRLVPCGVRSIAVKSTELNTEKGLKIKHFRELGVRFLSALLENK